MVQETFLRAWRKRASFAGRSTFRAWLYRIATNACLDALDASARASGRAARRGPAAAPSEVAWLQPYPDELLDGIAPSDEAPDAAVVSRETIELAFLVAIQHLPPRQRAVLILRDVLGWSAKDTAALLETSVASANSALQRARATLKRAPAGAPPRVGPGDRDRARRSGRCCSATWTRTSAPTLPGRGRAAARGRAADDAARDRAGTPGATRSPASSTACFVTGGPQYLGELRLLGTYANRQPAVGQLPAQAGRHRVPAAWRSTCCGSRTA